MSQTTTCDWIGASGTRYAYYVYPFPAAFGANQPGNYIYARTNSVGQWVPVYIGQGDLNDRAQGHHQAGCIRANGATHFHCHKNASEATRLSEERDLLARYTNAYQPTGCNERVGG